MFIMLMARNVGTMTVMVLEFLLTLQLVLQYSKVNVTFMHSCCSVDVIIFTVISLTPLSEDEQLCF